MSIDTITARIADIRSNIAALNAGFAPPAAGGSSGVASMPAALGGAPGDFASQLAALTGDGTSPGGANATGSGSADATGGAAGSDKNGGADTGRPVNDGADGDDVVVDAKKYLGIKYVWGGTDPAKGLDCSGLVQRVFSDLGVKLPRTVADQKDSGTAVSSMKDARPGDLLVFGNHHIGIYLGDNKMLHAPKTGDVVKIAPVYDRPSRIRRVVAAGGDGVSGRTKVAASSAARPAALRATSDTKVTASSYDALFTAATKKYDLPSGLLRSVARAESGLDPNARSAAGAIGLMQLMPGTARELGVDPKNPAQAVDGAARLLAGHLKTFGSVSLALAAYNAGAGAVRKYAGVPPYAETRAYVARVQHMMSGKAAR